MYYYFVLSFLFHPFYACHHLVPLNNSFHCLGWAQQCRSWPRIPCPLDCFKRSGKGLWSPLCQGLSPLTDYRLLSLFTLKCCSRKADQKSMTTLCGIQFPRQTFSLICPGPSPNIVTHTTLRQQECTAHRILNFDAFVEKRKIHPTFASKNELETTGVQFTCSQHQR